MIALSRIDRYLIVQLAQGLAIATGVIAGTILLIDVVEQLRVLGGRVSTAGAVALTLLRFPNIFVQCLPFATTLGAMLTFLSLARRSELAVIRATGISAWRFLRPVMLIGGLLGVVSVLVLDPVAQHLSTTYDQLKLRWVAQTIGTQTPQNGIWLAQSDEASYTLISGATLDPTLSTLGDARFFIMSKRDDQVRFMRLLEARKAILKHGFWQLSEVRDVDPIGGVTKLETLAVPTDLPADRLTRVRDIRRAVNFWTLPKVLAQAREAGLSTHRLELKYWNYLCHPIFIVAMGLVGAAFSIRLVRLGGTARLIVMGSGATFLSYIFGNFANALAASQAVPPWLAACVPPLAALFAVCAMIAYREDG